MAREIGVSSQLYGQYESGAKVPGGDFFLLWRKRFKTDLAGEVETTVSHEILVKDKAKAYDALFSVVVAEIASLKAEKTGEHPEVIVRRIYKAAEDVERLG